MFFFFFYILTSTIADRTNVYAKIMYFELRKNKNNINYGNDLSCNIRLLLLKIFVDVE